MTVIHEGADHKLHAFLVITREDGTHDEKQLKDDDEVKP